MVDVGLFRRAPGDLLARTVFSDFGFQFDIDAARAGDGPAPPVVRNGPHIGHEERQVPELSPEGVERLAGSVDHDGLDGGGPVAPFVKLVVEKAAGRHRGVSARRFNLHSVVSL
ncbi:hypothetical protein D3C80_1551970 [compost metagenome]